MVQTTQALREIVAGIPFDPRSRCHEAARTVAQSLRARGFSVTVRDGVVTYDTRFLLESVYLPWIVEVLSDTPSPNELEAFLNRQLALAKPELNIAHSWCEISGGENVIIVDVHPRLVIHDDLQLSWVHIVEEEERLPHKYRSTGRMIGNILVISRGWFPYVRRVRNLGGA